MGLTTDFIATDGEALAQLALKLRRRFDGPHAARNHERTANQRVVRSACVAGQNMLLRFGRHITRQCVVEVGQMMLAKTSAVHRERVRELLVQSRTLSNIPSRTAPVPATFGYDRR